MDLFNKQLKKKRGLGRNEMKRLKHIWKYLTSPSYRFWVDFCTIQGNLDRNMKLIEKNLRLKTYPMFLVEDDKIKKYGERGEDI